MTATATKTIETDVLVMIEQGTWEDGGFKMPQMDPALYKKVKKVLEALGGKWNRKRQATLFDTDGETSIREAVETGTYVNYKTLYQDFFTPDDLADEMAAFLGNHLPIGKRILEPSAGDGALIRALQRAEMVVPAFDIHMVEIDPRKFPDLSKLCHGPDQICTELHEGDFLLIEPGSIGLFDGILMNPPFTDSQDMIHVLHAFSHLAEGGMLTAIMSPGFTFRSDSRAKAFREWFDKVEGTYDFLPDDSFKAAGTGVRTVKVEIQRLE